MHKDAVFHLVFQVLRFLGEGRRVCNALPASVGAWERESKAAVMFSGISCSAGVIWRLKEGGW